MNQAGNNQVDGFPRKKLEFIVPVAYEVTVTEIFRKMGIKGFSRTSSKALDMNSPEIEDHVSFVALTPEPVARQIFLELRQALPPNTGLCLLSDVEVLRDFNRDL